MYENYKEIRGVLINKYRNILGRYVFVIDEKGLKSKIYVEKKIFEDAKLDTKWTIGQVDGKVINIRPGICKDPFKRNRFDDGIESLLRKAEALIPDEMLPDLPYMELAPDVHEWYTFEHELWKVGEEIRLLTSEYKMKFNKDQINRIVNICLDKRAKRGRQSFVLLLGRKMYADYADKMVLILKDDDIDGQVIDTLYKMQAGQYVELIKPFLNHNRTWIRNEAKRFIQKFEYS